MAIGKYRQWREQAQLEKIINWAANGCTDEQIAKNMGVSRTTLYNWKNAHIDIFNAIEKGRELSVTAIENAFFQRARGGITVIEEVEEFKGELKEGKPYNGTITRRKIKKTLPPDVTAQVFFLKNKAGYRSEPEVEVSVETAPRFYFDRTELEQD